MSNNTAQDSGCMDTHQGEESEGAAANDGDLHVQPPSSQPDPNNELLSAFQIRLQQTMSMVSNMPDDIKKKAMETLKGMLPHDRDGVVCDRTAGMCEQQEKTTTSVPLKVCGSAKRKIPARAGLPKKLLSTTNAQAPSVQPLPSPKSQTVPHKSQTDGVPVKRRRGRPKKFALYETNESAMVLEDDGSDDLVASKRGRLAKPVILSDEDEEEEVSSDPVHEFPGRGSVSDSQSPKVVIVKTEVVEVKQEVEEHEDYVDDVDEDEDWSHKQSVRRSARNAGKFHRKIYKQEARSRTSSEVVSPEEAQAFKCENGKWRCSVCDKMASNRQTVMVHLRTHTLERPYQCAKCERTFSILTNMQRHCRDRHGEEPTIACPAQGCETKLWTQKALTEHITKEHPEQKSRHKQVECPDCHKLFVNKHILKVHSAVHQKVRPYECEDCARTFTFKTNLLRHQWTHRDAVEYPHECPTCDKRYIEKKSLLSHMSRDHQGQAYSPGEKIYQCDVCDKSFCSRGNYQNHLYVHNGQKPHVCGVCGKRFSMKSNMQRHERIHTGVRPWVCRVCEKCFTEKRTMEIHMRVHTGEKPHSCKDCGKTFTQLGTLQSHMVVHSKERNYLCGQCGKSFLRKSHYNFHLRKHSTNPSHPCDECDMKFYRQGDLARHKMVHSNEKPFLCSLCPKRFTRLQYLKEHNNQHTGHRPHKCKMCDQTFADSSSLYKHQRTHTAKLHPTYLGTMHEGVTHVTQLPPGLALAMESIATAEAQPEGATGMDAVHVSIEQLPATDGATTEQSAHPLPDETIYAELGDPGTEKSYVCKACQASLPDLEACYTHQREHGHDVSFLVTIKQPEEGQFVAPEEGQLASPEDIAAMTPVTSDGGMSGMMVPQIVEGGGVSVVEGGEVTASVSVMNPGVTLAMHENVLQIAGLVTAADMTAADMTAPTEAIVTADQLISAVPMATDDVTTAKYYTTEGDETAQSVTMTLEDINNVIQNSAIQDPNHHQPYLILLKDQT